MDWTGFALGVLASILAAVILGIVVRIRAKASLSLSSLRFAMKLNGRLAETGFSNFYTSRADYVRYRGAATLGEYLAYAKDEVYVLGLWAAHGVETEGLVNSIRHMMITRPTITVRVALISPVSPMVESVAKYLDLEIEETKARVCMSLRHLIDLRDHLPDDVRHRLEIRTYDSMPAFSAILIDPETPGCRVQIDLKVYHQPRQNSVSFEFRGRGKYMVELLKNATKSWYADAHIVTAIEGAQLGHAAVGALRRG